MHREMLTGSIMSFEGEVEAGKHSLYRGCGISIFAEAKGVFCEREGHSKVVQRG
jgi:hypothetical protein